MIRQGTSPSKISENSVVELFPPNKNTSHNIANPWYCYPLRGSLKRCRSMFLFFKAEQWIAVVFSYNPRIFSCIFKFAERLDFEFPKNCLSSVTVFSTRPFWNMDKMYLGQCIKLRRPWWADVIFCLYTNYIQCVWVQKGWFKDSKRWSGSQHHADRGNLANSMGLEWTGVCICVSTAII
jgi:hypothetical protein